MNTNYCLKATDIEKKFKGFKLGIKEFGIPEGFATALIGENGAGKTTLLTILAGTRLDYKGHIEFFGKYHDDDRDDPATKVRERIGYLSGALYFMPQWTKNQIGKISNYLFENFHEDRYHALTDELALGTENKKFSSYSDGSRMKIGLAQVFARDTDLLLLDEPASPLDPLMRDKLCEMIRGYMAEPGTDGGAKSVLFSTHNIADMESVTDYAIIMANGAVIEQGFVDELKEKYIWVSADEADSEKVSPYLFSISRSKYGVEGLALAEDLDKLAGSNVHTQTPTLTQISVAVMKEHTRLVVESR